MNTNHLKAKLEGSRYTDLRVRTYCRLSESLLPVRWAFQYSLSIMPRWVSVAARDAPVISLIASVVACSTPCTRLRRTTRASACHGGSPKQIWTASTKYCASGPQYSAGRDALEETSPGPSSAASLRLSAAVPGTRGREWHWHAPSRPSAGRSMPPATAL